MTPVAGSSLERDLGRDDLIVIAGAGGFIAGALTRYFHDLGYARIRAVRHVHRALTASGSGWMDAEPEIAQIKPLICVVNEDGDRPEKRSFCESHGLRYVVLKRLPRTGLHGRQSTDLRGC